MDFIVFCMLIVLFGWFAWAVVVPFLIGLLIMLGTLLVTGIAALARALRLD